MAYTIKQAEEYIARAKKSVNTRFMPRYHMVQPVGWANDPNGLSFFNGEYHLFYQYNPYDAAPGAMHWGHFVSKDLISYRDGGVALSPSEVDETGCFSGGALDVNGTLEIVYTRHFEISDIKKEQVCIVKSADGTTFDKRLSAVFDNETLPPELSREDFRDPFPVRVGDTFYVLVGGKDKSFDMGVIVVLRGDSLDRLVYDFTIGPIYELGDMAECPSYCRVGGKDVIIVSGCHVKEKDGCYKNTHASVFLVGELDFANKRFKLDYVKEIDKGDTFYAPQIVTGIDKPIFIAWNEMWNKSYPTREMGHGWVGGFTFPREIAIVDGEIVQKPIAALEGYIKKHDGELLPQSARIKATIGRGGAIILRGDDGQLAIGNDGDIYLDTTSVNNNNGCIRRASTRVEKSEIDILLDVSTIEIFVDGGRQAITSRYYIGGGLKLIECGGVSGVKVFEVGVGNE